MLRTLRIRNLAVIEAVEVDLDPGFTALTGETGAGKSILVEAVGLLLGGRASADLVRTGTDAATIEAVFERAGWRRGSDPARDHAAGTQPLVRRRRAGHRAPAARRLRRPRRAARPARASAPARPLDASRFSRRRRGARSRGRRCGGALGAGARAAGNAWRARRWTRASAPRDWSWSAFSWPRSTPSSRWRARTSSSRPRGACLRTPSASMACAGLPTASCTTTSGRRSRSSRASWKKVEELAELDPAFAPHLEARGAVKAQLEDLASFLRAYADGVDASPARLQEVEDRLARIERLKRKYGPALDDVIAKGQALRAEAARLSGGDEEAGELERQLAAASTAYLTAARELSQARRAAAVPFARQLEGAAGRSRDGGDAVRRALRVHRGRSRSVGARKGSIASSSTSRPIRARTRVRWRASRRAASCRASCSRCGRTARAGRARRQRETGGRKTLIFDEVDAGIGGRAAEAVGALLRELGGRYPGAVHHAPGADRGPGHHAVRGREAGQPADGP